MTEDQTHHLREAIARHLELHGARDWNVVRERFPDISQATFWRYVKAIRHASTVSDPQPAEPAPRRWAVTGCFRHFSSP